MTMQKQKGFTLIEIMIASFVLAVGMLGSTALMLRGYQEADNTNYEAVAVQVAMNMAERMRANIQGVEAGAYDNISTTSAGSADCTIAVCSPADVAAYHTALWRTEIQDLMPNANPTATVVADTPGVPDSVFRITVNWDRAMRTGTDQRAVTTNSYVMIFQP